MLYVTQNSAFILSWPFVFRPSCCLNIFVCRWLSFCGIWHTVVMWSIRYRVERAEAPGLTDSSFPVRKQQWGRVVFTFFKKSGCWAESMWSLSYLMYNKTFFPPGKEAHFKVYIFETRKQSVLLSDLTSHEGIRYVRAWNIQSKTVLINI